MQSLAKKERVAEGVAPTAAGAAQTTPTVVEQQPDQDGASQQQAEATAEDAQSVTEDAAQRPARRLRVAAATAEPLPACDSDAPQTEAPSGFEPGGEEPVPNVLARCLSGAEQERTMRSEVCGADAGEEGPPSGARAAVGASGLGDASLGEQTQLLPLDDKQAGSMGDGLESEDIFSPRICHFDKDGRREGFDEAGDVPAFSVNIATFAYAKRTILHDIAFEIPQGARCGVLGQSGQGKSTLLSLITRLYPIPSDVGRVEMLGSLVNDTVVHQSVTCMEQTPVIFTGTIRENL
eukprot:5518875-Prymnesium_polylepis.1